MMEGERLILRYCQIFKAFIPVVADLKTALLQHEEDAESGPRSGRGVKLLSDVIRGIIFLAFFSYCFLPPLFAVDQDITDRYPSAGISPQQEEREQEQEAVFHPGERVEVSGFADIQQGYDNNVDLDSKRHKDGFIQGTANVDITYKHTDNLNLKAGVDIFETTYYTYNANNLLDISPYTGFDFEFVPGLISRNRFIFDYFSYPNSKESTFAGIVLSSYLRHYIIKDLYHELGCEYLRRWYPDQKISLADAQVGNSDRIDDRYRVKYNIGLYSVRFFIRLSNEFGWNDSNDLYHEYYDYWLYRVKPSIMFFLTDNLYADVGLIYRYMRYKDRRSTENVNRVERDHTYILNASLYYDISENITFGITYSYSENVSNDPFQKYSGSILSGGIYYNF